MNDQSYTVDLKREMSTFKKAWRRTKSYSDMHASSRHSSRRPTAGAATGAEGPGSAAGTPLMASRRLASVSMAGAFDVSPLTQATRTVTSTAPEDMMMMEWE